MRGQKRAASPDLDVDAPGPATKRRFARPTTRSPFDIGHVYSISTPEESSDWVLTRKKDPTTHKTDGDELEESLYPSRSRYPNDTYTVGWICAISTEYAAAQEFLDEEHGTPQSVIVNDNNDYTLGRIQEHNVVIALLSDCQSGTSFAACVARDMLHSFPNVKIGLMVSLASGAPTKENDIRLGDIVVSASGNGKGGVLQYDFGKRIQNKEFEETGLLNQPPTLLRSAVTGFRAQIERKGHCFEQIINKVLDRNPRLRKEYKRPELHTDRLFKSEIIHEQSCSNTCGHDPSSLVLRPERADEDDNPAIHYGLVGSGNSIIKDAAERDRLAAARDILCFETSAAGLMNHFPCLVICGISNYADTHNNKDWQGYAAMTATAYAKSLLYRISPRK